VAVQIAVVLVIWLSLDHAAEAGVGFLYSLPVGLVGWWFGRRWALVTALGCLALFVLSADAAGMSRLPLAALTRGAVFVAAAFVGAALGGLSEREMEMSSELAAMRQALTPSRLPVIAGLDVAASLLPAEHAVAGDFYLLTNGPGEWSVVLVGDVVGHGIEAAQRATFVRVSLVSICAGSADPAEILRLANRAVYEQAHADGRFVTCTCVAFHPRQPTVRWASAGHPSPIHLTRAEELRAASHAQPLGLDPELQIAAYETSLTSHESLLLYTDGLSEARDENGKWFGLSGILAATSAVRTRPAAEIIAALRQSVARFAGPTIKDDICMLVLRRTH
jgi:serine phosphatase RsbU (regulator of sigma subunit)